VSFSSLYSTLRLVGVLIVRRYILDRDTQFFAAAANSGDVSLSRHSHRVVIPLSLKNLITTWYALAYSPRSAPKNNLELFI
jgi:hypothetical protein